MLSVPLSIHISPTIRVCTCTYPYMTNHPEIKQHSRMRRTLDYITYVCMYGIEYVLVHVRVHVQICTTVSSVAAAADHK